MVRAPSLVFTGEVVETMVVLGLRVITMTIDVTLKDQNLLPTKFFFLPSTQTVDLPIAVIVHVNSLKKKKNVPLLYCAFLL